jgi:hypothetical protein
MKEETVICPYCGGKAVFTTSKRVYGGRDYGMIYLCEPCWAYCGVHEGTAKPLGRLADVELRDWKKKAHAAFDPIWQARIGTKSSTSGRVMKKAHARGSTYKRLAALLGIEGKDCHIGMFDVDRCKAVVDICASGELANREKVN